MTEASDPGHIERPIWPLNIRLEARCVASRPPSLGHGQGEKSLNEQPRFWKPQTVERFTSTLGIEGAAEYGRPANAKSRTRSLLRTTPCKTPYDGVSNQKSWLQRYLSKLGRPLPHHPDREPSKPTGAREHAPVSSSRRGSYITRHASVVWMRLRMRPCQGVAAPRVALSLENGLRRLSVDPSPIHHRLPLRSVSMSHTTFADTHGLRGYAWVKADEFHMPQNEGDSL